MNINTLVTELKYMIEDELNEINITRYNHMDEEIEDLIRFFMRQQVEYSMIPDMVIQMFMNPPEVIFIKDDGSYERMTLTANGLHETAITAYIKHYLEIHPDDQELKSVYDTKSVHEKVQSLNQRGITVVRIFHNSLIGTTLVATTPIDDSKSEQTYEQLKQQLTIEKNGKIEFGICNTENDSYEFDAVSKKI